MPAEAIPKTPVEKVRSFFRVGIWRLAATAIWVWGLGFFTSPASLPARLHQTSLGVAVAVLVGVMALYTLLKSDRTEGCISAAFLFPIYVAIWPMWLLMLGIGMSSTVLTGSLRQSRQFRGSLVPYGMSAAICLILVYAHRGHPYLYSVAILLAAIDWGFILLSLIAWVFQPLPWLQGLVLFGIRSHRKTLDEAALPSVDELKQGDKEIRQKFASTVKRLVSAHDGLDKIPTFTRAFEDAFIIGAFARKFLFSLLHVAFVFALAHFALNATERIAFTAYQGLPAGSVGFALFDYFYFSFMTLISANAGADPVIAGAKIAVALNALTGVIFLVILITTYSMVTRDRARQTVDEVMKKANETGAGIERRLYDGLEIAKTAGGLSETLAEEFAKVTKFKALNASEQESYSEALKL